MLGELGPQLPEGRLFLGEARARIDEVPLGLPVALPPVAVPDDEAEGEEAKEREQGGEGKAGADGAGLEQGYVDADEKVGEQGEGQPDEQGAVEARGGLGDGREAVDLLPEGRELGFELLDLLLEAFDGELGRGLPEETLDGGEGDGAATAADEMLVAAVGAGKEVGLAGDLQPAAAGWAGERDEIGHIDRLGGLRVRASGRG